MTHTVQTTVAVLKIVVKHQDPISITMKLTSLVYTELKHAQLSST